MGALQEQSEVFVQGMMRGMSRREAYRAAFDCTDVSGRAIDYRARKLFLTAAVQARWAELQKEVPAAAERMAAGEVANGQEVLRYLTSVMRGEGVENVPVKQGEALKAAELIGKRYGLFSERGLDVGEGLIRIVDDIPLGGGARGAAE